MIKAVIFDLGGTLYKGTEPSEEDYRLQWEEMKERGLEVEWDEYLEALEEMKDILKERHTGKVEMHQVDVPVRIMFDLLDIKASEEEIKEIGEEFYRNYCKRQELKEGVYEVIEYCKNKGKILGCISNGNKISTNVRLKKDDLKREFDIVIYSTGAGAQKSELKPFKIFLEKTNLAGRECLMVGNRRDEDMHAKNFGMKTVLITEDERESKNKKSREPDLKFRNLLEFREALEREKILER
ncbi:MAG: HAD family hydrolase [archaeon]